jgi:O-acetyl-ADP-ribose deacetylase (regulator of RNase III)
MGEILVEVVTGKITEQKADMIVNSSNTYLLLGSGTAENVRDAGGYLSKDDARYLAMKRELEYRNPALGAVLRYIDSTGRLPSKAQNYRLNYLLDHDSRELCLGDAAVFPSGDLSKATGMANYVSDAIGMTYDWRIQPKPPIVPATFDSVKNSLSKSFAFAKELECESVAVPVMCTRKGGLTKEESLGATFKAMEAIDDSVIKNVKIVLYSEELQKDIEWFKKSAGEFQALLS